MQTNRPNRHDIQHVFLTKEEREELKLIEEARLKEIKSAFSRGKFTVAEIGTFFGAKVASPIIRSSTSRMDIIYGKTELVEPVESVIHYVGLHGSRGDADYLRELDKAD